MFEKTGWTSLDYIAEINRLEKELKKYDWIKCSDRLPDKDGKYLVCGDIHLWDIEKYRNNERIVIARFTERKEWLTSLSVKYWMPLPELPESEDNTE